MPFIKFYIWPVTTLDQRKKLVKGVTDVVSEVLSVPKDVVTVFFDEVPQDRWGMGGKLSSEKEEDK